MLCTRVLNYLVDFVDLPLMSYALDLIELIKKKISVLKNNKRHHSFS
jgi:hypothetical protein